MRELRSWVNPYIDLIRTKPEYIISGERDSLTDGQKEVIRNKCKNFSKTICEICCGSGGHLIDCAAPDPNTLYIGFELRFKRAFNIAKKADNMGLKNVLAVRTNANLLPDIFPPSSLAGVYINFPDPWDLEKWKKNRILNPDYLDILTKVISPGGFFSYKTDHLKYFNATCDLITAHPHYQVVELSRDLYAETPFPKHGTTEFEKLFFNKKMPICYLKALIV